MPPNPPSSTTYDRSLENQNINRLPFFGAGTLRDPSSLVVEQTDMQIPKSEKKNSWPPPLPNPGDAPDTQRMVARNVTSLRNNYLLFNSTFPAINSTHVDRIKVNLMKFLIFMLWARA